MISKRVIKEMIIGPLSLTPSHFSTKVTDFPKKPLGTITLTLSFIILFAVPVEPNMMARVPDVGPDALASRDPLFHEPVSRGIHLVFNGRHEESLAIFDRLQLQHPDHPAPNFFKAAAHLVWMNNYRVNRYQNELDENIQTAIVKGRGLLKQKSDPWVHFYVGAAYGYQAFNRFRKHEWIGAYLDGQKGINHLKETLALDPKIYDVYLAFGTYHYWRTAKSNFLRVIAFWIPDKRELGLEQLQFSIDHGLYAPYEASYALVVAYFDYEKYDMAYKVLSRIMGKKARPSFADLYLKGRLFLKFKRFQEAESLFQDLLRRLESTENPSIGYQVECKYWIAFVQKSLRKLAEARAMTEQALAQSENRNGDMEVDGVFESFEDIRNQLNALLDDLNSEK